MIQKKPKIIQAAQRRYHKTRIYSVIFEMHEKENVSVSYLCNLAGISRASYYKWLCREESEHDKEDADILERIKQIVSENNSLFGYRKMTYNLNKDGTDKKCNHKKIYRIMAVNGIKSSFRGKTHSTWKKSNPAEVRENKLNRDFNAEAPNEKWCQDVTEEHYKSGKGYISTIFDLHDRFPVGVTVSKRNDTKLTDDTLFMAMTLNEGAHPLLHSDRGFQYTRKVYANKLEELGITQSMSRVGHCIDNGPMESFQGILKEMMRVLYGTADTYEEFVENVYKTYEYYIYKYPQERFHGKTAYQVRMEALSQSKPVQYPIAKNPKIEKYWQHIYELKQK